MDADLYLVARIFAYFDAFINDDPDRYAAWNRANPDPRPDRHADVARSSTGPDVRAEQDVPPREDAADPKP